MSSPCPPPARFWMEPKGMRWNGAGRRVLTIQDIMSRGASCLEFFLLESGSSPALGTASRTATRRFGQRIRRIGHCECNRPSEYL